MILAPGARIGPYETAAQIGAGGMMGNGIQLPFGRRP